MKDAAWYGLPGEVVRTLKEQTESDPVGLLVTYLTAFGAAVGRDPHAEAEGAPHPGRLFSVMVGDSSKARKGTTWAQVRRIFAEADGRFVEKGIVGGFGSGEALVDAAAADDSEGRLLVYEPEWARILGVGKRDGSTLSPLLRQAWDGETLAVRTRGSGTVTADNASVSMLGHVTQEELRAKLTDVEMANGYANRHCFVMVRRSKFLPSGGKLGSDAIGRLGKKTRDALGKARSLGILSRSPEAERRWETLYYKMADDEPGGLLAAVIGRDAAQVLRLSVLYTLTDGSKVIELCHLEAAWSVWEYCRQSAAYIFGDLSGNPVADKIKAALDAAGAAGLDGRGLDRACAGHATAGELRAALDYLDRKGLIATREEKTDGRPRKVTVLSSHADKADKAEEVPLPPDEPDLYDEEPWGVAR